MAKRDSRPARYPYRGHSFWPGSPCPRTFPTRLCCQESQLKWCRCPGTRPVRVHFALLCNTFAPWLLVGRIRSSCRTMSTFLHAIGLVRTPRVSQSRGPQRDRPPADCSYPGLAWHMGPWSMAHLTYQLLPVRARDLLRRSTRNRAGKVPKKKPP